VMVRRGGGRNGTMRAVHQSLSLQTRRMATAPRAPVSPYTPLVQHHALQEKRQVLPGAPLLVLLLKQGWCRIAQTGRQEDLGWSVLSVGW
jgi:hypothetical protein